MIVVVFAGLVAVGLTVAGLIFIDYQHKDPKVKKYRRVKKRDTSKV